MSPPLPTPSILHLDADAFFVACEQARNPSLRGRKCAVGGLGRGIIASSSYEARAAGVYTPMPTSRAMGVCPDLVLIPPDMALYEAVSGRMFDVCETLTPLVERNSIDEGYLDLEPCRFRSLEEASGAARRLQERLWTELGLSVSVGLASSKLVAQVASKLRKPRGFEVVAPGGEALAVVMTHRYVHDLPILSSLLTRPLAYLGLLGPRKRADKILHDMASGGFEVTPAMRARLHAPVGLDIGGDSPDEVALSIVAEIQAVLAGRDGKPLRERLRPIHD